MMRSGPLFEIRLVLMASVILSTVALSCRGNAERVPHTVHFIQELGKAKKEYDAITFRSYRKDGQLSAQMTVGDETRHCLTPPCRLAGPSRRPSHKRGNSGSEPSAPEL